MNSALSSRANQVQRGRNSTKPSPQTSAREWGKRVPTLSRSGVRSKPWSFDSERFLHRSIDTGAELWNGDRFQIKWQNQLDFWVSLITTLVGKLGSCRLQVRQPRCLPLFVAVALITGSVYFQLPQTAAGAFTRGGVIFISILFNSFQAFSELPYVVPK